MSDSFDLRRYLTDRASLVDRELAARMPDVETPPARLHEALRYSVLAGGKRLRPILALASAEAAGAALDDVMAAALAIEVLHTYTLVHDDLPCMDDDDLRRGMPTAHVKYDEATAVLAGDALQTLAFEWAAARPAPAPHDATAIVRELAAASGSVGVVGGQVADLAAEGRDPDAATLDWIHRHKTAGLIAVSCRIGAIAAGADVDLVDRLGQYGEHIGLAFQYADDILNATSDADTIGKPVGSDEARGKLTVVSMFGLDEARARGDQHIADAIALLETPGDAQPLRALARYIMERTH